MKVLECKNLSKSFGATTALLNASLGVSAGEVRAVLGGNGSGKSTLAKILGGSVKLTSGEIYLNEKLTNITSPSFAKKHGIVVTSQELSLISNLSVEQNLTICSIPRKCGIFVDRKRIHREAVEILAKVGIEDYVNTEIDDLAPNQQYLVEFAKALLQKPKILIIDEVTSALYREDVAIVRDIIKGQKENGCAVIFISHRMSEISAICDSVSVLRNGEMLGTFGVDEKKENELLTLMTGREIVDVENAETGKQQDPNQTPLLCAHELNLEGFDTKIDFRVMKNEIIGVAGLQGHGQSSLVRSLFAINKPVSLQIKGVEQSISSPSVAVKAGLTFISGDRQKEGTFSNRSIMDNLSAIVDIVLKRRNVNKESILSTYRVVMDDSKQPISALSGGNQQKVVFGRLTAAEPLVILADDPTKGIDVNAKRDVYRFLRDLANSGSGVVFVSSDDEELVELTRSYEYSKVIVMYKGRIVRELVGQDITAENIASYSIPKQVEL
ncbi:sugar ABC transporter ATP-binding protein [Synergistales bacterium]|nr:sugar ABC transporter ATP-binding protein [Synergistales bacterium]